MPAGTGVAIVGNAPETGDHAARIDAADLVVRFNNAPGLGRQAGTRTTHLVLVNHGGQMREWLEDPDFVRRRVVAEAGAFLLPFPPKPPEADPSEDGRDWTGEAAARLRPLGCPVAVLPEPLTREAAALVRREAGRPAAPSTGYLTAFALLAVTRPEAVRFDVFGFGFAGWEGHAFDAERRWFEAMAAAGRLRLHPVRN
ncbi:hypothetical protein F6X38_05920 [Aureimonas leprariae]|uniref:Uncharacterized protein n=1 Tax=Plantimonas leprariae TaxID=2615207 RepID=A0A7V7PRZ3_9HYPH|nr:hypothetical protein F6X38_05920 [Aureimonas leprariae]